MPVYLSPCESFSPAMLQAEPAALAPWIRFRMAKWLLGAKAQPSEWISTAGAATKIEIGTDVGSLELARLTNKLTLKYKLGPELAVEIGATLPHAMRRLLRPPRSPENVWLIAENHHDDQRSDALGIARSFLAIDLYRLIGLPPTDLGQGAAGAVLLFGVKPELRANLARLATYSRRLNALDDNQLWRSVTTVPGLRSDWASPARTRQVGVDARAIYEEVELIFSRYPFDSMVFVGALDGAVNDRAVAYFGEIQNPTEQAATNAYRAPDVGAAALGTLTSMNPTAKKLASFALGEVGKSKAQIQNDLAGQAKGLIDSKLPDGNMKKVVDFGLDEVGKPKKDILTDLEQNVAGGLKDKLDAVVTNPLAKKVVDFGLDHATERGPELTASALDALKDPLLQHKYESAAVAAIALASSKQVRNMALGQLQYQAPDIARTVFDAAGNKLQIPTGATNFLKNNAEAIVTGDWKSVAQSALSGQLGGGGVGNQAAAIVLEKITGQPVTSQAVKILGAQGLKALLDKGPVVASGKAGEAAVTGATDSAVQLKTSQGATVVSHNELAQSYDTVASPGLS